MKICFISGTYPAPHRPIVGTFVRQFVHAVGRQGHECAVIHPVSYLERRFAPLPPPLSQDQGGSALIPVHSPRYLSYSFRNLGFLNPALWTQSAFNRASFRACSRLKEKPDWVYGHFLYQAGFAAVRTARRIGAGSVVAVGEGTFWTVKPYGYSLAKLHFMEADAMLAVSSMIRDMLIGDLGIPPEKIQVFPNGTDRRIFFPRDRRQMRHKHGLPENAFIISFVGTLDDLKGSARLIEAVRGLPNVRLLILGDGPQRPLSDQILVQGTVPHDQVPELLCASDLFVLPTAEEGSCNAIVEALACGLPTVTSNGRYMDDLVDDRTAIRVEPYDVPALGAAIRSLITAPERRAAMAGAATERGPQLDINERARRVTEWLSGLSPRRRTEQN